jgi:hypothetical protein
MPEPLGADRAPYGSPSRRCMIRAKSRVTPTCDLRWEQCETGDWQASVQASMAVAMVSELAAVSIGLLSTVGESLALGAATIAGRGTLAQK